MNRHERLKEIAKRIAGVLAEETNAGMEPTEGIIALSVAFVGFIGTTDAWIDRPLVIRAGAAVMDLLQESYDAISNKKTGDDQ